MQATSELLLHQHLMCQEQGNHKRSPSSFSPPYPGSVIRSPLKATSAVSQYGGALLGNMLPPSSGLPLSFSTTPSTNQTSAPSSLPRLYHTIKIRDTPTAGSGGSTYKQCVLCSFSCSSSSKMLQHVILRHTGEKPFVCPQPQCSKSFTRKFSLHAHLKLHMGDRPFVCTFCPRSFSTNSILTCHLRTHTGERPHACPHCPYRSIQRTGLKVHMKNVHNDVLV